MMGPFFHAPGRPTPVPPGPSDRDAGSLRSGTGSIVAGAQRDHGSGRAACVAGPDRPGLLRPVQGRVIPEGRAYLVNTGWKCILRCPEDALAAQAADIGLLRTVQPQVVA